MRVEQSSSYHLSKLKVTERWVPFEPLLIGVNEIDMIGVWSAFFVKKRQRRKGNVDCDFWDCGLGRNAPYGFYKPAVTTGVKGGNRQKVDLFSRNTAEKINFFLYPFSWNWCFVSLFSRKDYNWALNRFTSITDKAEICFCINNELAHSWCKTNI